jgi:RimJ/RimL family protein N-acetyltransferase
VTHLRDFYDVMGACGMARPEWEAWHAWATDNAELWPLTDKTGKLVGGVFFKGHTVHIAVHPDWQGKWISKTMLKAYREWTHECEIVATPPADNVAACELARRLGFKERGRTSADYIIFVKEANFKQIEGATQSP